VRHFVDEIPSGIAVFDHELRYIAANPRWTKAFHLAAAVLAGRRHDELDPVGGAGIAELLRRALSGDTVEGCTDGAGELHRRVVGIRPRVAHDGSIIGAVAALHEVVTVNGEHRAEDAPDQLTGIAGRPSFLSRVRSVLTANGGAEPGTAMFLLDIDNFKGVNDLYGARVGDAVLKTVAARLMTGTRSHALLAAGSETPRIPAYGDLIARLGADEFGIILGATAGPADAEAFSRRLLQVITAPILAGDQRIRLTANIGYLIFNFLNLNAGWIHRLDRPRQERPWRAPTWILAAGAVLSFVNLAFMGFGADVYGAGTLKTGLIFAALIVPVFVYRHYIQDKGKFPPEMAEDLEMVGGEQIVNRAGFWPYAVLVLGIAVVAITHRLAVY